MDSSHHTHHAQTARDEAYTCSGYWGNAASGASGVATYDYLWAQSDSLELRIDQVARMCAQAAKEGGVIATRHIDEACCMFSTQLDIASALMFDRFESLISLLHHDKIENLGGEANR